MNRVNSGVFLVSYKSSEVEQTEIAVDLDQDVAVRRSCLLTVEPKMATPRCKRDDPPHLVTAVVHIPHLHQRCNAIRPRLSTGLDISCLADEHVHRARIRLAIVNNPSLGCLFSEELSAFFHFIDGFFVPTAMFLPMYR